MTHRSARKPELDGLRGIAVLLVVAAHYISISTAPGGTLLRSLAQLAQMGEFGLELFFVLSGFLIGGIILDHSKSTNFFRTFYIRRSCRILPLYLLLVVSYWVLSPFLSRGFPMNLLTGDKLYFWRYITFTQNFFIAIEHSYGPRWLAITWSLAVEEQFYLVVPLLLVLLPSRVAIRSCVVLVVAAPVARLLIGDYWAAYALTICRMDGLFLGVLAAFAVRNDFAVTVIKNNAEGVMSALAILFIGVLAMTVNNHGFGLLAYSWSSLTAAVALLAATLHLNSRLVRLLSNRYLTQVGSVSFGLYLFHMPVQYYMYALIRGIGPDVVDWSELAFSGLAFVISLVLSVVSFKLIEEPIISLGRRCKYDSVAPSSPPSHQILHVAAIVTTAN